MVVVRFQGIEHSLQGQPHQNRNSNLEQGATAMFKIPLHSQQSQVMEHQAGKRKWHESPTTSTQTGLERPQQRLKTPPLTIFYGGSVNVYDNVPESMVRALMTLAAAKSSRPEAVTMQNNIINNNNTSLSAALGLEFAAPKQVQQPLVPTHPQQNNQLGSNKIIAMSSMSLSTSSKSSTFPVNYSSTSLSLGGLSKPEERAPAAPAPTPASTPAPTLVATKTLASASAAAAAAPAGDLMKVNPRTRMQLGLPQARRASIQRFLEKRKHKQILEDDGAVGANAKPDVPHLL